MVTGKVISFDEVRGYGFVTPDEGPADVFVHVNDLEFDKRRLTPGVQVEFVAVEGDRGLKAAHVRLLDPPAAHAASPAVLQTTNPVQAIAPAQPADGDDGLCDVLSPAEFTAELTEILLTDASSLTGEQIVSLRKRLLIFARSHYWIED